MAVATSGTDIAYAAAQREETRAKDNLKVRSRVVKFQVACGRIGGLKGEGWAGEGVEEAVTNPRDPQQLCGRGGIFLRECYALSGTEIAYGAMCFPDDATRCPVEEMHKKMSEREQVRYPPTHCDALSGTGLAYGAPLFATHCYALSGTGLAYSAPLSAYALLRAVRYWPSVWWYNHGTETAGWAAGGSRSRRGGRRSFCRENTTSRT
eukprot:3201219-Rhodomonas_salina.3